MYLRFGMHLSVKTFRDNLLAQVSIPSAEEIESFKEAFAARHPLLTNCWVTMDGFKLFLQQSGNLIIQECYYNSWTHNHYVTFVFCFCPDRTIPIAFFNVPGSVHDTQVVGYGNIYGKLEDIFHSTGAKCCVDLAFGQVHRNTSTNRPRTYLVLWHQHITRGNWSYGKKAGNISTTDSWMGDAHDSDIVPTDQGLLCIQRVVSKLRGRGADVGVFGGTGFWRKRRFWKSPPAVLTSSYRAKQRSSIHSFLTLPITTPFFIDPSAYIVL